MDVSVRKKYSGTQFHKGIGDEHIKSVTTLPLAFWGEEWEGRVCRCLMQAHTLITIKMEKELLTDILMPIF